jgi:hypothetical protein
MAHGLPRTKDEQRQEFMTMMEKKMLDVNQPEVQQRVAELFGETGMMKTFKKDATRARFENAAMKEGKPVTPNPLLENMDVHKFIHLDQAKDMSFDAWPPESKQILIKHIEATEQFINAKAAAAMAQQQAAQGAGKSKAEIFGKQGEAAAQHAPVGGPHPSAPPPGTPPPGGPQPAAGGTK